MLDAEVEQIMRAMVEAVQTYDQVAEVCHPQPAICRPPDPSVSPFPAPLPDPTAQRRLASPKLWALPPAGSRARPDS